MSNQETTQQVQIFWNAAGIIQPALMYNFFEQKGIGLYYVNPKNKQRESPLLCQVNGILVKEVNKGYLLALAKAEISKAGEGNNVEIIMDSLHRSTGLFGQANNLLLHELPLEFVRDTADTAYLFFQNGVAVITADEIQLQPYEDFELCIWENQILPFEFSPQTFDQVKQDAVFYSFLRDITSMPDHDFWQRRTDALMSIIGYMTHTYKDVNISKAIILMDAETNGLTNGGTGKTLVACHAIGKIRNIGVLDGKSHDPRQWYKYSSLSASTQVILFDDADKGFNFENIYPLMTTGLKITRKYHDDVFIPFDQCPKVCITTNYAINGGGSSFRRRVFEFEISNFYSDRYQPRDKYGHNFWEEWDEIEMNQFFNTMAYAIQTYLINGLIQTEPINIKLTKLKNQTSEDFYEWILSAVAPNVRHDKRDLLTRFKAEYPEMARLNPREFTQWLRLWAEYKGAGFNEGHSGSVRYVEFILPEDNH